MFSVQEIANVLGVTEQAVRKKVKDLPGTPKPKPKGKGLLYSLDALEGVYPPEKIAALQQQLEETSEARSLPSVESSEAAAGASGAVAGGVALERQPCKAAAAPSEATEPAVSEPDGGSEAGAETRSPIPALSAPRTEGSDKRTRTERTIDPKLELLSSLDDYVERCIAQKRAAGERNTARPCQVEWHALLLAGKVEGLSGEAWDWVRAKRPGLSTVLRWRTLLNKEGVGALGDGRVARAKGVGYGAADPELWDAVRYGYIQGWNLRKTWKRAVAIFGEARVGVYSTLRRKIRHWEETQPQVAAFFRSPQEWRNSYMVAGGDADDDIVRPNQVWQLDATLADVVCGDGRRYYVLGMIDVFSRRCLFRVEKSSSAEGQVRLLTTAFRKFGKPEQIHTDNGKDYTGKFLKQVMDELRIEHRRSTPHSPWQKPFIERLFGSLTRDLFEGMPEFVGHNVAERERIRARQMEEKRRKGKGKNATLQRETGLSAAELQARLDAWAADYEQRVHGSLGLPPIAQWASVQGWAKTTVPEETLRLVCATPAGKGTARVGKSGILHDGAYYWTTDDAMWRYMGKEVYIRYVGDDLGELVLLDIETETPICYAQNVERLGYSQQQWKAQRRDQLKALRDEYKQVDKRGDLLAEAAETLMPPSKTLAALTQMQEMTEGLKQEPKRVKREMGRIKKFPTALSAPVENPVVEASGNVVDIAKADEILFEREKRRVKEEAAATKRSAAAQRRNSRPANWWTSEEQSEFAWEVIADARRGLSEDTLIELADPLKAALMVYWLWLADGSSGYGWKVELPVLQIALEHPQKEELLEELKELSNGKCTEDWARAHQELLRAEEAASGNAAGW